MQTEQNTATIKLKHPWPFPIIIKDGKAYKVQQPKPQRKPAPATAQQFEPALF